MTNLVAATVYTELIDRFTLVKEKMDKQSILGFDGVFKNDRLVYSSNAIKITFVLTIMAAIVERNGHESRYYINEYAFEVETITIAGIAAAVISTGYTNPEGETSKVVIY